MKARQPSYKNESIYHGYRAIGKHYVYKVEGDTVKKVEVKVGNTSSEQAEVISGLIETDKVVYKGQTLINDGSKVKIE